MAHLSKSERPKIHIPLNIFDYALEAVAILGLTVLLGATFVYFDQLPEQIPTHFSFEGQADKFGSKTTLWMLPVLGLLIYAIMTFINRRPEGFNYPVNITPENAERQYTMATRMVRTLKAFVVVLFAFLVWRGIQIALGEANGLGWGLLLLPITTLGIAVFYIFRSLAQK